MSRGLRKALVAAFLLLWGASLFLPTLRTNGADWDPGWWLLASGWMGFLIGQFAWVANPLLVVSAIVLLKKPGSKVFLGILGVLLLLLGAQMAMTGSIVDNEGGISHAIEARYAGFWLWIAAIALAGATSLLTVLLPQRPGHPPVETEPA